MTEAWEPQEATPAAAPELKQALDAGKIRTAPPARSPGARIRVGQPESCGCHVAAVSILLLLSRFVFLC